MEYATEIDSMSNNYNNTKFVGYSDHNDFLKPFFSDATVRTISRKITELTLGADPHNRAIIVPDDIILNVMNNIYENYRQPTGDIYSRYIIQNGSTTQGYIQDMIDQVIEVCVSDIRTRYEIQENNSKLSVWTTVLGDFNEHGLRQHPPIKVRNKRPTPMQFNMNY